MFFYKFMQPYMDAEADMGGSGGVTGGEPAATQTNTDTGTGESESVDTANQQQNTVQTNDDNAKYAAARRSAENETKQLRDANENLAKDLGYSSYKEFQDAVKAQKEESQRQNYINQYGVDPTAIKPIFEEFKKNDPDFIRMRDSENNLVKNTAAMDLNKAFPDLNVKSWDDVEKLPKWNEIRDSVLKGNDLVSAYKLAHFDDIVSGKQAAGKQAALNQINSKNHVQPTGAAAEVKDVNISDGEMKVWKSMFPKWNEDKIRDYVSKH